MSRGPVESSAVSWSSPGHLSFRGSRYLWAQGCTMAGHGKVVEFGHWWKVGFSLWLGLKRLLAHPCLATSLPCASFLVASIPSPGLFPTPHSCPNDLAQVSSWVERWPQGNKSPCYQPGPQVCTQWPSLGFWWAGPPLSPAVRQELSSWENCVWVCLHVVCYSMLCSCVRVRLYICNCVHVTICVELCYL